MAARKLFVKKYSNLEAFNILKDLMFHNKADKEIYILIALWLSQALGKPSYSRLIYLTKGMINPHSFNSNTIELRMLVHLIIQDLISEETIINKETGEKTKRGYKFKVNWDTVQVDSSEIEGYEKKFTKKGYKNVPKYKKESVEVDGGNEGRVIRYIYNHVFQILNSLISEVIEGKSYNVLSIRKRKDVSALHELINQGYKEDPNSDEVIYKAVGEGFLDSTLMAYRVAYGAGAHKNFIDIDNCSLLKQSVETAISDVEHTVSKKIYEELFNILNSNRLKLIHRELLKALYGIPSVYQSDDGPVYFHSNMDLFYKQFPEYEIVFKSKNYKFKNKRKYATLRERMYLITNSQLYKEAIEALKAVFTPIKNDIEAVAEDFLCSTSDSYTDDNYNYSLF